MTKRSKFLLTSIVLSIGFLAIGTFSQGPTFLEITALSILALALFYWSLKESIGKNATLLVLILPPLFTFGVGIFWFLLPATVYTRAPVIFIFGIVIYALALTSNIFTVSAIRTIALLRAAKGVGFVLTLLTSFLLFDAILSLKSELWLNSVFIAIAATPLILQGLWVSKLGRELPRILILYSLVGAYIVASVAALLFFWPLSVVIGSLFLTVSMYVILGLSQARIEGRLFQQVVKEYLFVGLAVFLVMFLATSWRG